MNGPGLRGKTALITGASSGIGRACALALAREGVDLALLGRREQALDAVAAAVAHEGVRAVSLRADVADRDQAGQVLQRAVAGLGRVDIVIANAGIYWRRPIAELTLAELDQVMAVNFYGAVALPLAALPAMLERKSGHLVFVSSLDGKKGIPPDGAYVASKFALGGFAEVLRQELRGTGVEVTVVCPGRVDTPMITDLEVPAVSAKMSPERVARAIVRGIRRRQAEILVPWLGGKSLVILNTFSARLGDWLVRTLRLGGREAR